MRKVISSVALAVAFLRSTLQSVTQSEGFIAASADQGQGAIWQDGAELKGSVLSMEKNISELLRKYELID